jgi:glutaredoxin
MNSLKLYFRASCPHSQLVLNAFKKNKVIFTLLDISTSQEYADELKEITGGFLSVPTVVYPDGKHMVEPSVRSCITYLRENFPKLIQKKKKTIFSFFQKKGQF